MIQVIAGDSGSGKTKRLIDIANEALKSEHGMVVFIDNDKRYMYDLRHEVRFVDAGEFPSVNGTTAEVFLGFLSGMLSVNFDITLVCIDAFMKLIKKTPIDQTEDFFNKLDALSVKTNCTFVLNVGTERDLLPAFVSCYAI